MSGYKQHRRKPSPSINPGPGIGLGLWLLTASNCYAGALPASTEPHHAQISQSRHILDLASDPELKSGRELFRKAEDAFNTRRYTLFKKLKNQLSDYPLHAYLEYRHLRRKLGKLTRKEAEDFLNNNDGSVIADKFRRKLVNYYARHQRWQDLIYFYQPSGSTHQQCQYLQALINTGARDQAFPQVEKIWLVGKSQPKTCDKVFESWQQAGWLTESLIWQRIELAMKGGKYRLARYLSKSLNDTDRQLVDLWLKVHRDPELATKIDLPENHALHKTILLHGVRRMSSKNPEDAAELWYQLDTQYNFNDQETYQAYRHIGLAMARQHHPDAGPWLSSIPAEHTSQYVKEWLIRSAIRQGTWEDVVSGIEELPLNKQGKLRWQFWWAYANEQLGNLIEAEATYRYLSGHRNYYGFLAADQLNLPYAFENNPLDIDHSELTSIKRYPETIRAHELFRLFYGVGL